LVIPAAIAALARFALRGGAILPAYRG